MKIGMSRISMIGRAVLCVSLAGCATAPGEKDGPDGRVAGAVGGAVLGCVAGALTGHGCAKGVVVGTVVGFAAGWAYESRKTASAQEVNDKYARQGVPIPANEVRVQDARFTLQPGAVVKQGEKFAAIADIDVVGGGKTVPKITHQATLLQANGKEVGTRSVPVDKVDGAGGFQSRLSYDLPKGMPGTYTVVNSIRADGAEVKKSFQFRVVIDERSQVTSLAQVGHADSEP